MATVLLRDLRAGSLISQSPGEMGSQTGRTQVTYRKCG